VQTVASSHVASGQIHVEHRVDDTPILLMVSDGMGGAAAGEVASGLAISMVRDYVAGAARLNARRAPGVLSRALRGANDAIRAEAAVNEDQRGMGATASVALVNGNRVFVGQVGDSRVYLFRSGLLQQITRDQSLVSVLVESGELTPTEAAEHPQRNVVLQALGTQASISPEISSFEVNQGDRLLLCSDGLMACLSDEEIAAVLETLPDADAATEELVRLANDRGAPDNITVLVGDCLGGDAEGTTNSPADVSIHRAYRADGLAPTTESFGSRMRARISFRRGVLLVAIVAVIAALAALGLAGALCG
jgi:PPM family protein phosphatase